MVHRVVRVVHRVVGVLDRLDPSMMTMSTARLDPTWVHRVVGVLHRVVRVVHMVSELR